ncbi:unnamed protein product [Brugia timori]|uniref:Uncharacterized protein n=1 Tax=Brugia timori TaxID=42155 RepID=A0A0R3QWC4_9BILA|nr:unnamed protein product [Brugia timori]
MQMKQIYLPFKFLFLIILIKYFDFEFDKIRCILFN